MNRLHYAMAAVAVAFIMVSCVPLVGIEDSVADDTNSEGPFEVDGTHYGTLSEAISAAKPGGTINMVEDAETEKVTFTGNRKTLDLGGNTLTIVGDTTGTGLQMAGMNNTITNGAIIDSRDAEARSGGHTVISVIGIGMSLTVDDVDITFYDSLNSASNYNYGVEVRDTATFSMTRTSSIVSVQGENATDGSIGVYVQGLPQHGSTTVTVEDDVRISVGTAGIAGNGSTNPDYSGTVINITGGTIEASDGMGIYHPQRGELSISGAETKVSGPTGIEIRAGSLTMTGGSVISTSNTFSSEANGSGSTTVGAGIAIVQHTSKLDIAVNISGGTVSGVKALYEENLQGNDAADLERISLSIIGGNFSTTGSSPDESVIDVGDVAEIGAFISGGKFSDNVDEYCEDGFSCKATDSGFITSYDGEDAVAQVGDFRYQTLAQAIGAVTADGTQTTITILRDFTMTEKDLVTVSDGQNIVLDLAGFTITVDSSVESMPITNYGILTVSGGTIDTTAGSSLGIIDSYGTLTIEDGRFIGPYTQGGSVITTYEGSTTTIKGGIFEGSPGAVYNGGEMTIDGGTFASQCCSACGPWAYTIRNMGGNMTVNYAEVTGTQGAICTAEGSLVINDGKFTTVQCPRDPEGHIWSVFYALYVAGEDGPTSAVVNGGEFTSYNKTAVLVGNSNDGGIEEYAVLTINGGMFKVSNNDTVAIITVDNNTLNDPDALVYGGSFDREPSKEVLAPGYKSEFDETTQTYSARAVTEDESVAKVGDIYFETVAEAIDFVEEGGTVTLTKDQEIDTIVISKGITLDLGGHTVTLVKSEDYVFSPNSVCSAITFEAGDSVLTNGTIVDQRSVGTEYYNFNMVLVTGEDSSLSLDNIVLTSQEPTANNYNYLVRVTNQAELHLEANTSLEYLDTTDEGSGYIVGVSVIGPAEGDADQSGYDATTLIVDDGVTIATSGFAICGNGTMHKTEITINGGEISATESLGIYHPQGGILYINGGTISGLTGVEIRSGTLNMTGGTVTGTYDGFSSDPNGNGSTTLGAGIAVIQHTTKQTIDVNISGGIVQGYNALYQANTQGNPEPISNITMSVTDGEFNATNPSGTAISATNVKNFVIGGSFSTDVADDLCREGYVAVENAEGRFGIAPSPESDVVATNETTGQEYISLPDALEFSPGGSTITMKSSVTLESTIVYGYGKNLILDLNGNTVSCDEEVFWITDGVLTIEDSEAEMSMDEGWSVTYTGGSLHSTGAHAVVVAGQEDSVAGLVLTSGMIQSDADCGVYVRGNQTPGDNSPAYDSSFTMNGGYIHAREFGAAVAGNGATFTINDGYIVTEDNAAVAGNGTDSTSRNDGGTTINIAGGTMVSNIVSDGYISCGIYHPQKGELNVTGGTIVSTNGIGILMRGGTLDMTGGDIISLGTGDGKVGDSNVITSGSGIFIDIRSNYPDGANIDAAVEDGNITSDGDAIKFLDSVGGSDPKDHILVYGGSFSSDVTAFCAPGLKASDDGSGSFTIVDAPEADISFSYEPVNPSDDQDVTVTVTVTGVQEGTEITYVWNGETTTTTETTKTFTVAAGTTAEQVLTVSFTSYGESYSDGWRHTFYGNHTVTVTFPSELGMSDQTFSVRDGESFDLGLIDTTGVPDGYVITGYTGYVSGEPVTSDITITAGYGISEPTVTYSLEYHDGYTVIVIDASHPLADSYGFAVNDDVETVDVDYDGTLVVRESGTYMIVVAAFIGGPDSETYGIKVIENVHVTVESESDPINPPVNPGDDGGYVPIPPDVVIDQSGSDNTVGVAACAAAAVAAAIVALILVAEYRKR